MKKYYAILDTRPKSRGEASALMLYYSTENRIATHRMQIIKHNHRHKLVRKIYEKDLNQKRGRFFVWGDVEEYRKHLVVSTAIVEGWLKRKR